MHHPDIEGLAFLFGTWRGAGRGFYPTIEGFSYREEVVFSPLGPKPVVLYTQRTSHGETGEPLHSETGYLRPVGENGLELALAQPTGIVEIHDGRVENGRIELRSRLVGLTASAISVTGTERIIEVADDTLNYRLAMAAVGHDLLPHLEATLRRVVDGSA